MWRPVPRLGAGWVTGTAHPRTPVASNRGEEYRLTPLDAEVAFVERLIGRIEHPETGWGPQWAGFPGKSEGT